jgi:virginiamycin B lyase
MEIASAPDGTIWATGFNAGLLLQLHPDTGTIATYYAPSPNGDNTGGLYGIAITPAGQVWLTIPAINVIARLDTATHRFVYYSIPTTNSLPLGIVIGKNNTFWFTEAGSDKIGMLQI